MKKVPKSSARFEEESNYKSLMKDLNSNKGKMRAVSARREHKDSLNVLLEENSRALKDYYDDLKGVRPLAEEKVAIDNPDIKSTYKSGGKSKGLSKKDTVKSHFKRGYRRQAY
jgi:hypothetical protein